MLGVGGSGGGDGPGGGGMVRGGLFKKKIEDIHLYRFSCILVDIFAYYGSFAPKRHVDSCFLYYRMSRPQEDPNLNLKRSLLETLVSPSLSLLFIIYSSCFS